MEKNNSQNNTATNLAYLFVGIFALVLIIIGLVAANYTPGNNGENPWLDLLKSGFLLLGGGLTTIIGYYFGSRGVETAQNVAEVAKTQYEKMELDLEKVAEELAPTAEEGSLQPKV